MIGKLNWDNIKKPIAVDYSKATDSSYIFYNQVMKIENICDSMKYDVLGKIDNNKHNRVISIVGDRGTGKSSLLETSINVLKEKGLFVIDIIDPSTFNTSLNVTEILLSKLYMLLKELDVQLSNNTHKENLKHKLYNELKKALEVLNNLRLTDVSFIENNMTHEVLENYMEREQFSNTIKYVLDLILIIINETKDDNKPDFRGIAILIDDLDLVDNEVIYSMAEDIRKYLATSAVVVIAYRETQLQNAIVQEIINKNKLLIDKNLINDFELRDQAAKYLEKLMPYATRIFMPVEELLYSEKFEKIVSVIVESNSDVETDEIIKKEFINKYNISNGINLKEWFYNAIGEKIKLDLKPLDEKENTQLLFPNNLRGILDLIKIVHVDLKTTKDCANVEEITETVLLNLEHYRTYYRSYCSQSLSYEQYKIIRNWEIANVGNKNFTIYFDLWTNYFKELQDDIWMKKYDSNKKTIGSVSIIENELFYPLDILKIQPENVAIADVYLLLDDLKIFVAKTFNDLNFIYVIKVFYSLELTKLFLEEISKNIDTEKNSADINNYLILLNSYIIPEYALYDVQAQYKATWTFKLYKSKYNDDINNTYAKIVDKVCYTKIPRNGDLYRGIRPTIDTNTRTTDQRLSRYRTYFSTYTGIQDKQSGNLEYNLFAFLGKKDYFENLKNNAILYDNNENHYILTSMFDIDKIAIANYTRRSEDKPINYFMRSINKMLNNDMDKMDKFKLNRKILEANYSFNTSNKYLNVYSDEEIEFDFDTFDLGLFKKTKSDIYNNGDQPIIKKLLKMNGKEIISNIILKMLKLENLSNEDKLYLEETKSLKIIYEDRKNKISELMSKYNFDI